jgi:hypothetical protein
MSEQSGRTPALALPTVIVWLVAVAGAMIAAQQGPVATMFGADQKRHASLALSFLQVDLPPSKTANAPARVYLSAGDLERAFDRAEFRPDAAIVPTNTDLQVTSSDPATQRVLIDRVQKEPDVMRDLEDQIAARRKQLSTAAAGDQGLLRIGLDTFVVQLPRAAAGTPSRGAFPGTACLLPTDFVSGGAIDRRELFAQDRFRQGIAACLTALDAAGMVSVVVPLMGAASSTPQTSDAAYEGQRVLKECRLINSVAGIALGIHDFAPGRRNLRDIGVVQWDQEISGMFQVAEGSRAAQTAQLAYEAYAEQIRAALRKGLAGQKTTASDVHGSCAAILNVR